MCGKTSQSFASTSNNNTGSYAPLVTKPAPAPVMPATPTTVKATTPSANKPKRERKAESKEFQLSYLTKQTGILKARIEKEKLVERAHQEVKSLQATLAQIRKDRGQR